MASMMETHILDSPRDIGSAGSLGPSAGRIGLREGTQTVAVVQTSKSGESLQAMFDMGMDLDVLLERERLVTEVYTLLNAFTHWDSSIQKAVGLIARMSSCSGVAVRLKDEKGSYSFVAVYGTMEAIVKQCRIPIGSSTCLCGAVALGTSADGSPLPTGLFNQKDSAFVTNDFAIVPLQLILSACTSFNGHCARSFRSSFIGPLRVDGEVVGELLCEDEAPGKMDGHLVGSLKLIANAIASSYKNSLKHAEVRNALTRYTRLLRSSGDASTPATPRVASAATADATTALTEIEDIMRSHGITDDDDMAGSVTLCEQVCAREYGGVFRGIWNGTDVMCRSTGQWMSLDPTAMIEAHQIVKKLTGLRHPNVIQVFGLTSVNKKHYLIEQIADGPIDHLMVNGVVSPTSLEALDISIGIALGMSYMHGNGVIHGALALRNILYVVSDGRYLPKLSNFGLRQLVRFSVDAPPEMVRWLPPSLGTPHQRASESGRRSCDVAPTKEDDVWSFGVTLWELLSGGALPYGGISDTTVQRHIAAGGRLERPAECTDNLYGLMQACWNDDPAKRPTFNVIAERLSTALVEKQAKATGFTNSTSEGEYTVHDSVAVQSTVMETPREKAPKVSKVCIIL